MKLNQQERAKMAERNDRIKAAVKGGDNMAVVAKRFGVSRARIHQIVTNHDRNLNKGKGRKTSSWTPEMEKQLVSLYSEGRRFKDIAKVMGLPNDAVRAKASSMRQQGRFPEPRNQAAEPKQRHVASEAQAAAPKVRPTIAQLNVFLMNAGVFVKLVADGRYDDASDLYSSISEQFDRDRRQASGACA